MVFQTEDRRYLCVSECLKGIKMDVYVCRDEDDEKEYYVWAIHNNELAKEVTKLLSKDEQYKKIKCFSMGEYYCVLQPYRQNRNVMQYAFIGNYKKTYVRELLKKITFLCMTCGLPWEIIYVLLHEQKISIDVNKEVYFTYDVLLSDFEGKTEIECVSILGDYLEDIMEMTNDRSWAGYRLISMKNRRKSYSGMSELYRDLNSETEIAYGKSFKIRIMSEYRKRKPVLTKILKVSCVVIGCIAIIVFISNTVFDSSPVYRLFVNTFKRIGTESMMQ